MGYYTTYDLINGLDRFEHDRDAYMPPGFFSEASARLQDFYEAFAKKCSESEKCGHWIETADRSTDGNVPVIDWYCSECGEYGYDDYKYCPMCGAKMIGTIYEYTEDQQDSCWEHTFKDCNECKHAECKHNCAKRKAD